MLYFYIIEMKGYSPHVRVCGINQKKPSAIESGWKFFQVIIMQSLVFLHRIGITLYISGSQCAVQRPLQISDNVRSKFFSKQ